MVRSSTPSPSDSASATTSSPATPPKCRPKRDRLSTGLADAGLDVLPTQGTYFASCDITSIGETNGINFCLGLPERAGVVAVPSMVFFDNQGEGASIIRFAFCKKDEVIDEAVARLKAGLS